MTVKLQIPFFYIYIKPLSQQIFSVVYTVLATSLFFIKDRSSLSLVCFVHYYYLQLIVHTRLLLIIIAARVGFFFCALSIFEISHTSTESS